MRIHVYRPPKMAFSEEYHRLVCAGLRALGHEVVEPQCCDYREPVELAVVQGWIKGKLAGLPFDRAPVVRGQVRADKPIVCVERGYLGNRDDWTALGWNGFNGLADWSRLTGMDSSRWDRYRSEWGVDLAPWRERWSGGYVVLAGQIPTDANLDGHDHTDWLCSASVTIQQRGYPVKFRPHPKMRNRDGVRRYDALVRAVTSTGAELSTGGKLEDLFDGAEALVCWNSNSAVEAVMAGLPAVVCHPNCMAWPVADHDVEDVAEPRRRDRVQWAHDLAWRQWSRSEIESGEAWRWVLPPEFTS